MGAAEVATGLLTGAKEGIGLVGGVQDMWKKQDETTMRDKEMNAMNQQVDLENHPIMQNLDPTVKANILDQWNKTDKTRYDANILAKNVLADQQLGESFQAAMLKVNQQKANASLLELEKNKASMAPADYQKAQQDILASTRGAEDKIHEVRFNLVAPTLPREVRSVLEPYIKNGMDYKTLNTMAIEANKAYLTGKMQAEAVRAAGENKVAKDPQLEKTIKSVIAANPGISESTVRTYLGSDLGKAMGTPKGGWAKLEGAFAPGMAQGVQGIAPDEIAVTKIDGTKVIRNTKTNAERPDPRSTGNAWANALNPFQSDATDEEMAKNRDELLKKINPYFQKFIKRGVTNASPIKSR